MLETRGARGAQRSTKRRVDCLHCGSPVAGAGAESDGFCCTGCAEVYRLLHEAGLERYYALGGGEGHPVVAPSLGAASGQRDRKWLEPVLARLASAPDDLPARVLLDLQGVHCAACVWLIDRLFRRRRAKDAFGRALVNPALGTVELTIGRDFPLAAWIDDVEAFGYRLGPPLKARDGEGEDAGSRTSRSLLWRMGVCVAIAMNTMILGVAVYCGLEAGPVYRLFQSIDFALSLVSVLVGGTVFFRSAVGAARRGILHLDLPIALGIALVFVSSTWTYAARGGSTSYFDTLNVFIALMLVGRFLQERVLAKNRAMLLASEGAEGIFTRRASGELARCTDVKAGDLLLLAHGDVVPVESMLAPDEPAPGARFSLDWISGESAPRTFAPGASIPAGAFAWGGHAVRVQALTDFEASALVPLLRTSTKRDADVARATAWHARLTRVYVAGVLLVALLTFAGWLVATRDLARTLDVVAAVLVVTCPCAFGIATPLAYELAQGALRKVGLYVRTPGFLDRAAEVTRVVFDKTGTLTTGRLVVRDPAVLDALSADDRTRLFALVVQSSHPKSRAIEAALLARADRSRDELVLAPGQSAAREVVGKGVELGAEEIGGCRGAKPPDHEARGARSAEHAVYRLGAPAWAVARASVPVLPPRADVVFTRDGEVLAAIEIAEELRTDAAFEVSALVRAGYDVHLLSGDAQDKVLAMARRCGIPEDHAYGGRSPEDKARWLAASDAHDAHGGGAVPKTLFVGDGINDSLAAEAAYCAGTPAIDRPFMASRSDFYFVTPGLRPVRAALVTSRLLARVVRRNLAIALAYNAVTVSLAVCGLMTPLLCAVLMPLSSLSTVLATTAQISLRRDPLAARQEASWRS